ncbi:MAG: hypothetical protein DRP09_16255 [Candidatus Thorarchaeota archaeon]|nr:MAG: hypothetical protein DRP09_16255 [Candidatus Thorarchaeota archaeon]
MRQDIHVLAYSDTGGGKSTFAATFPKPMLVLFFDPLGKDQPYLADASEVGELVDTPFGMMRDVKHAGGITRLEYYHDHDPYNPSAYSFFLQRMGLFDQEKDYWRTVVLDSITFMELTARKYHQYALNPTAKDGRQWYAGSKELLEEMLMMRFAGLKLNVVTLAHVDESKDELHGEIVRNPAAPGKLSKRLGAAYGEHYRLYTVRGDMGEIKYVMQTTNDGLYAAQTQIKAPNPCYPHYDSIWENYEKGGTPG